MIRSPRAGCSTSLVLLASAVAAMACGPAPTLGEHATREKKKTSGDAIINGTVSDASQDAVVLISFPAGNCTGTMIAKNLVLTARHCVGETDMVTFEVTNARATDIEIFTGVDAPRKAQSGNAAARGRQLFTVGTNMIPDVALLVVDGDVDVPIAPVRLDGGARRGEKLTIVGFGLTENNSAPDERMQRTGKTVESVFPDLSDLSKGEFTFTEAACSGDSGGPALSATSGAVIGVASRVGNGLDRTEEDPTRFCRGDGTVNFYTGLDAVPDLVKQAFDVAGATPKLEGQTAPPDATDPEGQTTPNEGEPTAPPKATDPTKPPPKEAPAPSAPKPSPKPAPEQGAPAVESEDEPRGSASGGPQELEPPPSDYDPESHAPPRLRAPKDADDDDDGGLKTKNVGACSAGPRGATRDASGVLAFGIGALALAFSRRRTRR